MGMTTGTTLLEWALVEVYGKKHPALKERVRQLIRTFLATGEEERKCVIAFQQSKESVLYTNSESSSTSLSGDDGYGQGFDCPCGCLDTIPLLYKRDIRSALAKSNMQSKRLSLEALLCASLYQSTGFKRQRTEGTPISTVNLRLRVYDRDICVTGWKMLFECSQSTLDMYLGNVLSGNMFKSPEDPASTIKAAVSDDTWIYRLVYNHVVRYGYPSPQPATLASCGQSLWCLPKDASLESLYTESYLPQCQYLFQTPLPLESFIKRIISLCPNLVISANTRVLCSPCSISSGQSALKPHVEQSIAAFHDYLALLDDCSQVQDTNALSLNFALPLQLPMFKKQLLPLNGKVPYSVSVFGIHNASTHVQHMYYMGEGSYPATHDQGIQCANGTISLLHHYLSDKENNARHLILYLDSDALENKNRWVTTYLAWRCLCGMNETITLRYLCAGHGKLVTDLNFGLARESLYEEKSVASVKHAVKVVNQNYPQTMVALNGHEQDIHWYQWEEYLGQMFKSHPFNYPVPLHELSAIQFSMAFPGKYNAHSMHRQTAPRPMSLLRSKISIETLVNTLRGKEETMGLNPLEFYALPITPLSDVRTSYLSQTIAPHLSTATELLAFKQMCDIEDEEDTESQKTPIAIYCEPSLPVYMGVSKPKALV